MLEYGLIQLPLITKGQEVINDLILISFVYITSTAIGKLTWCSKAAKGVNSSSSLGMKSVKEIIGGYGCD